MFVRNVNQLSEESLCTFFKKFGNVKNVNIAKDVKTGNPRGFAFVTFESVAEASLAVSDGDEAEVSDEMLINLHKHAS